MTLMNTIKAIQKVNSEILFLLQVWSFSLSWIVCTIMITTYWRRIAIYLAAACTVAGAFQPISPSSSRSCTVLNSSERGANAFGRRPFLEAITTLSFLLLSKPVKAEAPETILITGANSGIGYIASKLLAGRGHTVVLACRTLEKAQDAAKRIQTESSVQGALIPAQCDLASLESIRSFVAELPKLKIEKFDVLCLNAGLSLNQDDKKIQRTNDGFELTVGTNHLGHVLLNNLLLPKLNKTGGRIVVTASGVHDPLSPGGGVGQTATLGDLLGFERDGSHFEMVDGEPYNADKAYKDSKLCNVMFTRELQRRLVEEEQTKNVVANSFSPGLITQTGFFRNQSPFFSKAFGFIVTNVAKVSETPEWGGACLAYMTTVRSRGAYYLAPAGAGNQFKIETTNTESQQEAFDDQFKIEATSVESQDDGKAKKLWQLSEKLVGIEA